VVGLVPPAAEVGLVPSAAVVGFSPAADVLGSGEVPPAAEVAGVEATGELADFDEATGAAEEAGAGAAALTPHCPIGLLPGNLDIAPKMVSWIAELMLQEVEGSLSPPMRPGHLSIPESPASQLSMIC
jgi:hypothetical protein